MWKIISYTEILNEWRDTYKEKASCQDTSKKNQTEIKSVTFKRKLEILLSLALQSSSLEMTAHEMFCNRNKCTLRAQYVLLILK